MRKLLLATVAMIAFTTSVMARSPDYPTGPRTDSAPPTDVAEKSLLLCEQAIDDPFHYMVLDMLVHGGDNIGKMDDNIKRHLDNVYGKFLTMHDDAIVEAVNHDTGMVTCSVSFDADLDGIVKTTIGEGDLNRAKFFLDQIKKSGSQIKNRWNYVVRALSNGNLFVNFQIAHEAEKPASPAPARRHYGGGGYRRIGICVGPVCF